MAPGKRPAADIERANHLRKRQVTGLLILLAVLLAASIYHAGIAQVFPRGWWHIWSGVAWWP